MFQFFFLDLSRPEKANNRILKTLLRVLKRLEEVENRKGKEGGIGEEAANQNPLLIISSK